jgi:hypothetical protein
MAAVSQIRYPDTPGRALKRRVSDAVYLPLVADQR